MQQARDLLLSLKSFNVYMQSFLTAPLLEPNSALPEISTLEEPAALQIEQALPTTAFTALNITPDHQEVVAAEPVSLPEVKARGESPGDFDL